MKRTTEKKKCNAMQMGERGQGSSPVVVLAAVDVGAVFGALVHVEVRRDHLVHHLHRILHHINITSCSTKTVRTPI